MEGSAGMIMTQRHRIFLWVALSALAAAGCGGPDFEAICDEREKCWGGNDADREACVVLFEGYADIASDIGCADEFDTYFVCQEENFACREVATGEPCMVDTDCDEGFSGRPGRCSGGTCMESNYTFDLNAQENPCEAEENAYERCF
ncbi:MAG: hypothetical protein HUU21_15825 [Polyangiaceae bacterium]|nr:hypothetical protein [Polyangiaceae bacterium]